MLRDGKKSLGDHTSDWASILANMAINYQTLKQFDLALKYTLQAIELDKKVFGEKHKKFAIRFNSLARIYTHLNRFDDAIVAAQRAMDIREEYYEKEHPKLAIIHRTLGRVYLLKGDLHKASQAFIQAQRIDNKTYPENNRNRLFNNEMLLLTYVQLNDLKNSKALLHKLELTIKKHNITFMQLITMLDFCRIAIENIESTGNLKHKKLDELIINYLSKRDINDYRYILMSNAIKS